MHREPSTSPAVLNRSRRLRLAVLIFCVLLIIGVVVVIFLPKDPYALRRSDWKQFTKRFIDESGRVIDTGNQNVSHSEGQGYGMLLAVAFNDKRTFDRMWSWTQENLRRPDDAFFAWLWTPEDGGKIGDPNTASDGDLLIAWALLRAFERWDDLDYQQAAGVIIAEFQEKAVVTTSLGEQMIPGQVGFQFEDGVVLNPSYGIFPAYEELKSTFPSPAWEGLMKGGLKLIEKAEFGKWDLTPNWILVGEDSLSLAPDKPAEFGYDAIRVPLHVAWHNPKSPLLLRFAKFWEGLPTDEPIPATVDVVTNDFGPYPALPGMQAVIQLTLASTKNEPITVTDIAGVDDEESYYSASLKLLTMLAIHEAFQPEKR